ncbi:hypothetical protein RB213_007481 [Colletotrichum asianum]
MYKAHRMTVRSPRTIAKPHAPGDDPVAQPTKRGTKPCESLRSCFPDWVTVMSPVNYVSGSSRGGSFRTHRNTMWTLTVLTPPFPGGNFRSKAGLSYTIHRIRGGWAWQFVGGCESPSVFAAEIRGNEMVVVSTQTLALTQEFASISSIMGCDQRAKHQYNYIGDE